MRQSATIFADSSYLMDLLYTKCSKITGHTRRAVLFLSYHVDHTLIIRSHEAVAKPSPSALTATWEILPL